MNIILIINILLIIIVLFLILKKNKKEDNIVNEDMKGIELLEFQQNLKLMIEEFKNFSDEILKKIDEKNEQIKKSIKEADIKISEIKYLIERVNLMKQNENKVNAIVENTSLVNDNKIKKDTKKIEKIKVSKFMINEKENEKINEKDKYENIKNLLENGLSVSEISKITGLSKGEIELIKNLKQQK